MGGHDGVHTDGAMPMHGSTVRWQGADWVAGRNEPLQGAVASTIAGNVLEYSLSATGTLR